MKPIVEYLSKNGFGSLWNIIKKLFVSKEELQDFEYDISKELKRIDGKVSYDDTFDFSFEYLDDDTKSHLLIANIPANTNVVLNVVKRVYGYPSNDTIWVSNHYSVSVDSLKGSYCYHSYGSGKSVDLLIEKSTTYTPLTEYSIQVVYCSCDPSLIKWNGKDYFHYNRAPKGNVLITPHPTVSDDTVQFDIENNSASVSLENSSDFIGNVKDQSENCTITVTGEELGKMYRFTFTKNISDISLVNSDGVEYSSVDGEITQGDVITFTSISNTADGWINSLSKAGITSEDNSVDISWEDGVADLSVKGALSVDDKYRVENGVIINTYGKKGIAFNVGDEWISVGGYELNKIERKNGINVISKIFQHYISKRQTDGTVLSDEELYKIVDYNNMGNLYDKVADIPTMIAISKHLIGGVENKKYTITEDGATIPNDATDVVIAIVDETKREFNVQLPTNPSDLQVLRVRCIGCINQYGSGTGCNIYYFKADGTKRTNYVSNHYEVMFYTWFEDLGTWQYRYEYPV